jgi:DNA polymerase-3 subunit gamma/tau
MRGAFAATVPMRAAGVAAAAVQAGSAGVRPTDAYRALYRTWRPHRFGDVVGQEHVTRTLRNAIAAGRLHHAYLFCGPRGTGKTTVARILAQAANCLRPQDGEPCGACANCEAIAADRFLDLQEIDGATNRGIDEVRGLREDARYAAINGRAKVYIIDEVHMLTEPAWNALLKTLEEPPAGTIFILATTDPRKIPLTALSRCQRFDFRRFTEDQIASRLQEIVTAEGLGIERPALDAIAQRAEGGMRDALSLLDQGIAYAGAALTADDVSVIAGAADEAGLIRTLAAVAAGDAAGAMAEIERFYVTGRDFGQVARDLAAALRDRLVGLLARSPVTGPAAALTGWTDRGRLLAAIDALAAAEADMRRSGQPRFVLEVALLRLVAASAEPGAADAATQAPQMAQAPAANPSAAARPTRGGEVAAAARADAAPPRPEAVPTAGPRAGARPPSAATRQAAVDQTAAVAKSPPPPAPAAERPAAGEATAAAAETPAAVQPSAAGTPPLSAGPPAGARLPAAAGRTAAGDETAAAAEAPPGSDALAQVLAHWPEVLDRLKPGTRTFVRQTRPVAAERRRLTLHVTGSYDLLKRRIPEIGAALAGVLGGSWGVELVADSPEGASATPELAARLFDGQVLEPPAEPRRKDDDIPL